MAVLDRGHDRAMRRLIASELVGDHHPRHVHCFLSSLRKNRLAALASRRGLDQDVQDIAVLVDGPPQVLPLAVDREEDLVEVPRVAGPGPAAAQPGRVDLPELHAPVPDRLVGTITPRCSISSSTSRKLSGNR